MVWRGLLVAALVLVLLVGLAAALLPFADRWRPQVSHWLSQQLGQPVSIGQLEGRWEGRGPRLSLRRIAVGHNDDLLTVENAEVAIDLLAVLNPGRGMAHFRILVDEVVLTRTGDGQWRLQGLPDFAGSDSGRDLSMLGGMGLRADRLLVRDESSGGEISFDGLDLDISASAPSLQLSGLLRQGDESVRVMAVSDPEGLRLYGASAGLTMERWLGGWSPVAGQAAAGIVSGEVWGYIVEHRLTDLEWTGNARDLTLGGHRLNLDQAALRFSRTPAGWRGQLTGGDITTATGLWPASGISVSRDGNTLSAAADWLPLDDIGALIQAGDWLPPNVATALAAHRPRGVVRDLNLSLNLHASGGPELTGSVTAQDLAWVAADDKPGLEGLDVTVRFDGRSARVTPLAGTGVVLDTGGVLRWPLELTGLEGHADLSWGDGPKWRLEVPRLKLTHRSTQASARLVMEGNEGRPFVDLAMRVIQGQVDEARYFWPGKRFNAKLMQWLDRALVGGRVTGGAALIYGDLDDWPFRHGQGHFEAIALVEDGRLDFNSSWPLAEDLAASLTFSARGMSGKASGKLMGLDANNIGVELESFRNPMLNIRADGAAGGNAYLEFLKATPLYARFSTYLDGLSVDGQTLAQVEIALPLKKGLPPLKVNGSAQLDQARVVDSKWDMVFEQTSGPVEFSENGVRAQDLETRWNGFPAALSLRAGGFVINPELAAEASLSGVAPASVFTDRMPQLAPLLARIPAACPWRVSLVIGRDGELAGERQVPRLTVESRLTDTEILLPPPLAKPSGTEMPLSLGVDFSEFGNVVLDLADVLKVRFRRGDEDEPWGGTVHLGPGEPARNPEPGLLVEGDLDYIDLDQWQDFLREFISVDMPADDQRWLTALDLRVAQLRFAHRDFTNLHLKTARDDTYWTLQLSGDQVEGSLRIPINPDSRRLLLAELDRLSWPASTVELGSPTIDPAGIPPLRFVADSVDIDGVDYGSVSFESYPVHNGMHIDHLETRSGAMTISAAGDWWSEDDTSGSRFGLTITGDELGQIFQSFGYSPLVEGGQTMVRLDVNWPGSPTDFELARLDGDMDVQITGGQIVEVDPGAGRIFGLMSLQALPRRLLLDFSDLFKTGLTFDVIEGSFLLDDGNAYSENLSIKGPTADIEIKGRTGLADQDYDQVVTVIPEVGATLPIVGALAGGGAGAAAAFLLQNVFDRQIDRISQFHYSVTGTFEQPRLELIGADDQSLELETARALRREVDG